jgi:hypothetical protein
VAEVRAEGEAGSRRHLVCRLLEGCRLEVWSLELVQRWEGGIHINKGRVGKDRGSKETDGCPLTLSIASHHFTLYLIPLIFDCLLSHYLSIVL